MDGPGVAACVEGRIERETDLRGSGLEMGGLARPWFDVFGAGALAEPGTLRSVLRCLAHNGTMGSNLMNGIIYLVGLVVVVLAILSFLGIR